MNMTQTIIDTVNMMVVDLKLDLSKDEVRRLKEKALHELCMKNGFVYFGGTIQ